MCFINESIIKQRFFFLPLLLCPSETEQKKTKNCNNCAHVGKVKKKMPDENEANLISDKSVRESHSIIMPVLSSDLVE